jgi:hypothetical protein
MCNENRITNIFVKDFVMKNIIIQVEEKNWNTVSNKYKHKPPLN